uniref:Uncharacterized protein n=1 Tax=Opuntia streptacantha TaxID=393608 RepID=A0A7C9AI51_OPUST
MTSFKTPSMVFIFSSVIFAPKQMHIMMLHIVNLHCAMTSTYPFSRACVLTRAMWLSRAHFLIHAHCLTRDGVTTSVARLRRRARQSGPYSAELMAHLPREKTSRVGDSAGRLAKTEPRLTRASWMRVGSVRIIRVRWPICMVKMGPYFSRRSRTTYMKGRLWRITWKRFPTIGQPGGPGGRFLGPPPTVEHRRHHNPRNMAPRNRRRMSRSSITVLVAN